MAKKKIKKKIFSIIIRGNNKAHWLKILLKKIFSQTNKNFEIIFGDNNSNDETLSLLKNYKIKKIIKFHNYRPGFVLNKCVKSSSGKYIIFISSHCVPFNNYWLEDFLTFMEKNSDIVAASGKQLPLPGTSSKDQLDLSILFRDEEIISRKDSYLNNANAIYRSSYLKKNLFDKKILNIEDRLWAKKINQYGNKIAYTAKSPVFHIDGIHQHKSDSPRSANSINLLVKDFEKYWKKTDFLRSNYYKYFIIINARRCKNISFLLNKLRNLFKTDFIKSLQIKKILIISNFKNSKKINNVKIEYFQPTNTVGDDLKKIYSTKFSDWKDVNYILSLNSEFKWRHINIKNLINYCTYNSSECVTLASKVYSNFDVIFKDGSIIKSNSLENREDKPWIKLYRDAEGCILIPKILKEKILFNVNVKTIYI